MLEVTVLSLFILGAFAGTLFVNVLRARRDEKQEKALADIVAQCHGEPVAMLRKALGDPYEIETGTTGRDLYIWKFPPARTLPRGRGLLTMTATFTGGILTEARWKRHL